MISWKDCANLRITNHQSPFAPLLMRDAADATNSTSHSGSFIVMPFRRMRRSPRPLVPTTIHLRRRYLSLTTSPRLKFLTVTIDIPPTLSVGLRHNKGSQVRPLCISKNAALTRQKRPIRFWEGAIEVRGTLAGG